MLIMSVTFYLCIGKMDSKSFLPHFSTFVEILLKSCRKKSLSVCKLSCINFLTGFKTWGFGGYFLPTITTSFYYHLFLHNRE